MPATCYAPACETAEVIDIPPALTSLVAVVPPPEEP